MTEILKHCATAVLLAFAVLAGCSNESTAKAKSARSRTTSSSKIDDSAGGSVDLGNTSYKAAPLAAIGAVGGTIRLTGSAPRASTPIAVVVPGRAQGGAWSQAVRDQAVCGVTTPSAVVTSKTGGLSNAIVWLADVKTGKSLPADRREDLSSEKCLLDPRVQAAVVGTTFNVINDDKLLHRLVFLRLGTHDTLTVMPFFNSGQIVATERLAKMSGIVEVRCVQHPWTHAYIAVFDHPYYAVTDGNGAFNIDSLPPGTYKMMVWHEGMSQPTAQRIQIAPGGAAKADIAVAVGG